MTDLSLDDLNPAGEFESALRAYAEGSPARLAIYIANNGIPAGYQAQRLSEVLMNPKKFRRRLNSNERTRELLGIYETIIKVEKLNFPIWTNLVWKPLIVDRQPRFDQRGNKTLRKTRWSVYELIAAHVNRSPAAVEIEHKRMKKKGRSVS